MPATRQPFQFASALSDQSDTAEAIRQTAARLEEGVAGPVDLAVIFATAHHRDGFELIHRKLKESLSPRVALAVTCQGVIGTGREIQDQPGLSILAARLPGVVLEPFMIGQETWTDTLESPEVARKKLWKSEKPAKAIFLLPDPFSAPMLKLLSVLGEGFAGVPVVGGVASGANEAGGNRLMLNGKVADSGAVGVVIGGGVRLDCVLSQGCRPIGKPLVITKSQRHVVMELGGKKALLALQDMARELTEEEREMVESQGLMVGRVIDEYKPRFGRGDFLIRGVIGVDQEAGYLAVADPQIRVGQTIQFQVRDKKTAAEDFALLLEGQKLHGDAAGAVLFSCNGRGTNLFDQPDADAKAISDAMGAVPLAGFFAAGELGPVGSESFVHGHTASLVVFRRD